MKKLVCDLCGESDFVKVEGMFECQVCGAKYSIDEARTLFKDFDDEPRKDKETNDEAPNLDLDEEVGTPVFTPKANPTIVRKVVVAKPVNKTSDASAAKKIVAQVKKPEAATTVAKTGSTTVIKKVVVKPVAQVKPVPQKKVQPKPVDPAKLSTVGVGTSQMIENLFILSENAYDSENYTDAENYAVRIIELDASNSDAWLMKGNCAGKLSTPQNFRFLEAINCWNTCLTNSSKEEFEDYQFTVRTNTVDIIVAYVLKNCLDFAKNPTDENFAKIKETIDAADPIMRKANQTYGVDLVAYEDKLASNISAVVTKVSKTSIQDFGKKKETQTDEAYAKFVKTQDVCINAWNYLMDIAKKHGTVTAILSNVVKMHEAIIRNCGHKVSGSKVKESVKCSMAERNQRLEEIKKAKKKLDDKFVDIRKRDRVEQKVKNEKYWEEHQEEKQQLLDERQKLDHEIFELENSKLKMPELNELKKLEEEAIRLQVLKDNPVYSNKERAGFMEQLNKVRKQIVTKKRELASRLNPIEEKIEKYKKRMYNIDKELNQNR
ncbi:MAG: hypothetical protein IJR67_03750 [Acholeplasmatales bacterium]|nr:hypothetical protein [Acholeplasmatales bacterium]